MIIPTAAQAPLQNVAAATLAAAAAAAAASPYANTTRPDQSDMGGQESDQNGDWSSTIGIVTAIIGNVLISFALNTQKYAHLRLAREADEQRRRQKGLGREEIETAKARARGARGFKASDEHDEEPGESEPLLGERNSYERDGDEEEDGGGSEESNAALLEAQAASLRSPERKSTQTSYLRSPYWWVGIVLMVVGEAGNFLAYGFAPASIVSPLGVVALISNCIIAPIMLKEPFRKRDLAGVLIAIGGAVTVVLSANDNNPKLGPHEIWDLITRWEFVTYFGITLGVIIALMMASMKYGGKSIFIDLGLVGLFGGYTALATKGVASMLSYTFFHALGFPVTYLLVFILVGTAVMQIKYLNRALQRFDATQVIPTQFVLFTLSVILGSAVLYRDFERTTGSNAGEFIGGCVMTFLGVWIITTGRPQEDDEDEDERAPEREDAIHLALGEEYEDDEVAHDASWSGHSSRRQSGLLNEAATLALTSRNPSMASLTKYPSSHHRRPSMPRLTTPAIKLTSDPPSQAITTATTPAAAIDVGDNESLMANPWASESLVSSITSHQPAPLLHNTISTPILPSEAQILSPRKHNERPNTSRRDTDVPPPSTAPISTNVSRPSTPAAPSMPASAKHVTPSPSKAHHHPQTEPATPATPQSQSQQPTSHLKRGSISSLFPGPLTSPLSSSLSAVVADSLRKGVEMRGGRPRRNTKEALGFGGWLGGGPSVAGPRDGAADPVMAAAAASRRRGLSVGSQTGPGMGPIRSTSAGAADADVLMEGGGEEGGAEGEGGQNRRRGRSISEAFGELLRKVKSGENTPGSDYQDQQQPQQQGEDRSGPSMGERSQTS